MTGVLQAWRRGYRRGRWLVLPERRLRARRAECDRWLDEHPLPVLDVDPDGMVHLTSEAIERGFIIHEAPLVWVAGDMGGQRITIAPGRAITRTGVSIPVHTDLAPSDQPREATP